MNALANSQDEELEKFLEKGYPEGKPPVRFARYTGQEKGAEREAIRSNPPDILLTNYMMLELLLTRSEDRELVRAAQGLRFLVFDELHTYRGRQGADVALLIRRCRQAFGGHDIICIGTSATMASGGTSEDQKREVAKVAQTLFGVPFEPRRSSARRWSAPRRRSISAIQQVIAGASGSDRQRTHRPRELRSLPPSPAWPPGSSPRSACAPRREPAGWSGRPRGDCRVRTARPKNSRA